jgi:hypothetical protein
LAQAAVVSRQLPHLPVREIETSLILAYHLCAPIEFSARRNFGAVTTARWDFDSC